MPLLRCAPPIPAAEKSLVDGFIAHERLSDKDDLVVVVYRDKLYVNFRALATVSGKHHSYALMMSGNHIPWPERA